MKRWILTLICLLLGVCAWAQSQVYLYELDGYDHGAMAEPAHHILKQHIRRICSSR